MNFQTTNKIWKVVLSVGDESGIGPEIILKALILMKYLTILTLHW